MRRAFPWVLSIVLLIAFVASFSELQRMRKRFGEVTRHAFHDHAEVRRFIIRSAMAQESAPIVILGDSLAELARFPSSLCSRPVVNAGIGGATLEELARIAPEVESASLVVVIAGTNNSDASVEAEYSKLLAAIKPSKIAVAATVYPSINRSIINAAERMKVPVLKPEFSAFTDVHPTPRAYGDWVPKIVAELSAECN